MKISEIMKKVISVDGNMKIREAAEIMSKNKISSLVAINKNKLVGIITEHDILNNIASFSSPVAKVMSKNIITVQGDDSLEIAAHIMAEKKVGRLPVVDGSKKLIGIITALDLLEYSEELDDDFLFG